jgi:hypothetical protein
MWTDKPIMVEKFAFLFWCGRIERRNSVVLRIPSYGNEAFLLDNPIGFLHQVPYGSLPHQGWPIVGLDNGSLSFWRISGESIKLRGFYYHQIPFVKWADRQMRGRFISILSEICTILTPEPIVVGRNPVSIDGMVENQRLATWTLSINIHSLNINSFLEIESTDVRHCVWGGTGQPFRTKVQPVIIFFRRMETIK